jgi:hypothetical protein
MGYTLTARARPSTIRNTAFKLLPWAIYAALPVGRPAKMALVLAHRFSPLVRLAAGGRRNPDDEY